MSANPEDFVSGDGRSLTIEDIANTYRNIVNLSIPRTGQIRRIAENVYNLTCQFSATDCDTNDSIKTSKDYLLTVNSGHLIESVRGVSEPKTTSEIAQTSSENGRFVARLKSAANSNDKRQLLEIWDRSRLLKTIDISEVKHHGQIIVEPVFSSFCWSRSGEQDKLLYVCNSKTKEQQSFFKPLDESGKSRNYGENYLRREDWGECLAGIEHTLVAVLNVADDCKISTADMVGFSLADSQWIDDKRTISVAYREEPRRLGLVYCNNRPSKLVIHDWSQSPAVEEFSISKKGHCLHNPRISNLGKKLVYLSNGEFGPHYRNVKIHFYDLDSRSDQELSTDSQDLFIRSLNRNCFSTDDEHLLFVNQEHVQCYLCLYNLEESKMTKIRFPTSGLSLLDFRHNLILGTGSEINATPTMFVAALNPVDRGDLVAWHQIEECVHLEEIDYETYKIPTKDGSSFITGILVSPSIDALHRNFPSRSFDPDSDEQAVMSPSELPTVVVLHGGPHSAFTLDYLASLVFHARVGFRSLLINYRGSIGVSSDYIETLCGAIGRMDVDDCLQVIRHFISNKVIDPSRLILFGGSHGGFLAAHLSCQKEFEFVCAVIRNPVIDISSLHATSDIPDWSYYESLGCAHKFAEHPSSYDRTRMHECSPIAKFEQAYVPSLLLLGAEDRRVNMCQGERWFELLKARGIEVSCKVYTDKHDLAKPEVAIDSNITAARWMLRHLRRSVK